MTALTALWVPIVLSAVFVFVTSSIIHMAPLWHRGDYPGLAGEDQVMASLRPLQIPPGDYMMPRASSMQQYKTPEFREKIVQGPVMLMTVMPNRILSMGRNMTLWFVFSLVVSLFSAYLAGMALGHGADASEVVWFTAVTAFSGYVLALWQMSIWYYRSWSLTIKSSIDGVIYAVVTAATFAWLWPR